MPLHLIKLAVGCDSVKELKEWVAERMQTARKKGLPQHHIHITRMVPKRDAEILAGGSLYWVIKGEIAAREKIIGIEPFRDPFRLVRGTYDYCVSLTRDRVVRVAAGDRGKAEFSF